MNFTFNVVFVPNTARLFRLFILTMLEQSNVKFRLVANGLPADELIILSDFCDRYDRLELFVYPVKKTLDHGSMLNILFHRFEEEYFCFLDNDILAIDSFGTQLEQSIATYDVFSSCHPLAWDTDVIVPGFAGDCIQSPAGLPLATSYLCSMRREKIAAVIRRTGIGFETYQPQDYLPAVCEQNPLDPEVKNVKFIDTGKLLMLMSSEDKLTFGYQIMENLHHIGGLSSFTLKESSRQKIRRQARLLLNIPYRASDLNLDLEIAHARKKKLSRNQMDTANLSETQAHNAIKNKLLRRRTSLYFAHYFRHLFNGEVEPRIDMQDAAYQALIMNIRDVLFQTFTQHKQWLT